MTTRARTPFERFAKAGLGAACVASLLLGCSSSSDDGTSATRPTTVTQSVGPDGGVLELDGATLTIPAGALTTSQAITVTATPDAAPDGFVALSRVYHCEPSGLNFAKAATMAITFTGDGGAATMFWSSAAKPTFSDVGGRPSGTVMSAGVMHFSEGFVGRTK